MKKVVIAIVVIVALLAVGAYVLFFAPASAGAPPSQYSDSVSFNFSDRNTEITAALYHLGINDSFVETNSQLAYVGYNLPDGYDSNATQRMVIGAVASAVGDQSAQIVAVQYVSDQPKVSWSLSMADFLAFARGELTSDQLDAKIDKRTY